MNQEKTYHITVLGAGAGGTAWGQTLARSGHKIILWDADTAHLKSLRKQRENTRHYPGFPLSENISTQPDLDKAVKNADAIVLALPAAAQTEVATQICSLLLPQQILIQTGSGVRVSDGALLTDVWSEAAGKPLRQAIMTGPNFAQELMEEKYTAFTVASDDEHLPLEVGDMFNVPYMRPYYSTDVVSTQVAGAIRNVLAIAAGLCDGLEHPRMGINFKAAMMCRGLIEMQRLAVALGGRPETIMGLAGVGDVILHATSPLSRNYQLGTLVARGMAPETAADQTGLAEGVATARIVAYLAAANGLQLSVIAAIDGIMQGDTDPTTAFTLLVEQPRKYEFL